MPGMPDVHDDQVDITGVVGINFQGLLPAGGLPDGVPEPGQDGGGKFPDRCLIIHEQYAFRSPPGWFGLKVIMRIRIEPPEGGQVDPEGCSLADFAVAGDIASMTFYDSIDRRQAQTGSPGRCPWS